MAEASISEQNAAIARALRRLADSIERAPSALCIRAFAAGGDRQVVSYRSQATGSLHDLPAGFSAPNYSVFIGDESFVDRMASLND